MFVVLKSVPILLCSARDCASSANTGNEELAAFTISETNETSKYQVLEIGNVPEKQVKFLDELFLYEKKRD